MDSKGEMVAKAIIILLMKIPRWSKTIGGKNIQWRNTCGVTHAQTKIGIGTWS
jgi:hypothetical protein